MVEREGEVKPFEIQKISNKTFVKQITEEVEIPKPIKKQEFHVYLVKGKSDNIDRTFILISPGKKEDLISRQVSNQIIKYGWPVEKRGDVLMLTLLGWVDFSPIIFGEPPEEYDIPEEKGYKKVPVVLLSSSTKMARNFGIIATMARYLKQGAHIEQEKLYFMNSLQRAILTIRPLLEENKNLKNALANMMFDFISAAESLAGVMYSMFTMGMQEFEKESTLGALAEHSKQILYLMAIIGIGVAMALGFAYITKLMGVW